MSVPTFLEESPLPAIVGIAGLILLPLLAIAWGVRAGLRDSPKQWIPVFFSSAIALTIAAFLTTLSVDWLDRSDSERRMDRWFETGTVISMESRPDGVKYRVDTPDGVQHYFTRDEYDPPLGLFLQSSAGAGLLLATVTLMARAMSIRFRRKNTDQPQPMAEGVTDTPEPTT